MDKIANSDNLRTLLTRGTALAYYFSDKGYRSPGFSSCLDDSDATEVLAQPQLT